MTTTTLWKSIPIVSLLIALPASAASAAYPYTVIDLGTLGGLWSGATDINNTCQVVVNAFASPVGNPRAFLWQNGTTTDLGTLGGPYSAGLAMSNVGQVVGWADTSSGMYHPFLWGSGSMRDLGTLFGDSGYGLDVNDNGQVVGRVAGIGVRAFLWENGVMVVLRGLEDFESEAHGINGFGQVVGRAMVGSRGYSFLWTTAGMTFGVGNLGGSGSYANAINDLGQVAGAATTGPGDLHAYLWENGMTKDLGTLGDTHSEAADINNSGQVVGGTWLKTGKPFHAFIWEDGAMTDLNDLLLPGSGWELICANAINDKGWIVGDGLIGGERHAFLLVPEPATLALVATGLGAVRLKRRRKA